ncbi:MAG: hypothetical protein ACLFWD_02265 [Anaerolineales bacterium]
MRRTIPLCIFLVLATAACGGRAADILAQEPSLTDPFDEPTQTGEPVTEAVPSTTPSESAPSFDAKTYVDEAADFEFEYPTAWTLPVDGEEFARGQVVQLYSGEEPQLTVSLLRWDPSRDLDAYLEVRRTAWESSGNELLSEEMMTLNNGQDAARFLIEGPDGLKSIFMVTTIDERYLILSGAGDIELLTEVTNTLKVAREG